MFTLDFYKIDESGLFAKVQSKGIEYFSLDSAREKAMYALEHYPHVQLIHTMKAGQIYAVEVIKRHELLDAGEKAREE